MSALYVPIQRIPPSLLALSYFFELRDLTLLSLSPKELRTRVTQWAECRPEVVRQHAAKVWGASACKENAAPPKVFSLVKKSASEVASLASAVSQVTTDTEERVALNRMEWQMLE